MSIGRTAGVYKHAPWWLVALGALSAVNIAAGVSLSLRPAAASDLDIVSRWAGALAGGQDIYLGRASIVDYPPWALVVLWPLTLVSGAARQGAWVVLNIGLAGAVVLQLLRRVDELSRIRLSLGLLLAATASLRSLVQFSLLSYALALAGAFSTSNVVGGILLGLSLIKPQIGGVVLIWALLTGRWRRVAIALCVPMLLTIVAAALVAVNPVTLATEYFRVVINVYGLPPWFAGHTELRPWLWGLWPDMAGNYLVTAAVGAVLFSPAIAAVVRHPTAGADRDLDLLAMCGVVSLLSVRHLSSDLFLLLPALLAWRVPPFASRSHAPRWLFFGLAAALILALPGWSRWAADHGAPQAIGVVTEADRVVVLAAWAALAWRLSRPIPASARVES